ncbi:1182_t:CDS:2, partial [Racocetra persica]
MTANIKLLLTVLETHTIYNKEDFFSNCDIDYPVPESFSQIFGYTFSEKDIKKQLNNFKMKRRHLTELMYYGKP